MINPMLNNFSQFMQNFNEFVRNFSENNKNMTPQQKVQELLNSGQMTQQDFEQLRILANQMTGKKI